MITDTTTLAMMVVLSVQLVGHDDTLAVKTTKYKYASYIVTYLISVIKLYLFSKQALFCGITKSFNIIKQLCSHGYLFYVLKIIEVCFQKFG
jgi:hypothetical protein